MAQRKKVGIDDRALAKLTVLDAGADNPIVAYPDEVVFDVLFGMLKNNVGRVPVVSRENSRQMVGYLNRATILSAWTRQMEEEGVREHGWLAQFLNTGRNLNATQK